MAASPSVRYLMGRNKWSRSIARLVEVAGIVDDFTSEASFEGIPVVKTEDLPRSAMLVSCVHGHPTTAKHRLDAAGIDNLDLFAFARWSGIEMAPVFFWPDDEFDREYASHERFYGDFAKRLADDESVSCLENLVKFRLTRNLACLSGFTDRQDRQYFEPFIPAGYRWIYVDGGTFDGLSVCRFARAFPAYHTIFAFEPVPSNLAMLKARTEGVRNLTIVPRGMYSSATTLRFAEDGVSSHFSENGGRVLDVTTIDSLRLWEAEKPVFIKLDVEGVEKEALEGASQTIRECWPFLAVCVYHRAEDLREIPETLLGMRKDYRVFLRHYLEGPTETVMYFIPK